MAAYGYPGGYHHIGGYPAAVFYYYGGCCYVLAVYGYGHVAVFVVQAAGHYILGQYHIVAYGHGAYDHIAHAHQAVVAYDHIAHAIVYGAEVFDGGVVAEDELVKWQYVHPGIAADNGAFAPLMEKAVEEYPYPQPRPGTTLGQQHAVYYSLYFRVTFNDTRNRHNLPWD